MPHCLPTDPCGHDGFSLPELIIVLILVVVLTIIAYPSYQQTILVSRRAQARAALVQTLLLQEHYYTQTSHYLAFNADTPNSLFKWWSGESLSNSYYELQATNCPGQTLFECVLLIATPGTGRVQGNWDPLCGSLAIDSHGNKSQSLGTARNPSCW